MNIFGVLHGKASTHVWQNPQLKSMGNTVSAHICQIKVFGTYPVILYRLRLDHSIHWWKKKFVSLGTTKFGVLYGKASTHVWQNPQLKLMGNTVSAHISQIKVFRPYPVILYRLRLDHFIHCWKKWVSLGTTKFGILDGKAFTHVWPNPQLKSMEILFLLISPKLMSLDPTLLYCIDSDWTTLSIGRKKMGVPQNDQIWRTRW